eukprot:6287417-Prymnesium_polylepis.1
MQPATVWWEPAHRRNRRQHEPRPVSKGRRDRSRGSGAGNGTFMGDSTHSTRVWYVSGSCVRHASHAPGLVTLGLWLG